MILCALLESRLLCHAKMAKIVAKTPTRDPSNAATILVVVLLRDEWSPL